MRATFNQSEMVKGLQRVMGVVPTKMPMPALSNIHLRLDGGALELIATDLEVTVTSKVKVLEAEGKGGVLIPAKRFSDLMRELPDVPLDLDMPDPQKVTLRGAETGVFDLPSGDPIDFPELPKVEAKLKFGILAESLKRMINKTALSISKDEMRPILTGFLIQLRPNEIRLVTTDGHRLSRISRRDVEYKGEAHDAVVPAKAFNQLLRNLEDGQQAHIAVADTRASFAADDYRLTTRLIEGNYPKYESVIPQNNPNRLTVRTGDFMAAVRRAAIFASQISRQVKLTLGKSEMKLETEDPELGGRAEVGVAVDYTGEPMEIAYNAGYLMDVLRLIDTDEVSFEMGGTNDAALVKPSSQPEDEEFFMLLMPIRLR